MNAHQITPMNPEEAEQYQNQLYAQARLLSAAEERASAWRFVAIAIAIFALWCILDLRGCIPSDGASWSGMGP